MTGTTEYEFAKAALRIAASQPNGIASHRRLRAEIPNLIKLTAADLDASLTRKKEPMWHQIVRNIKSHYKDAGNFIAEGFLEHVPRVGYKITTKGAALLTSGKI